MIPALMPTPKRIYEEELLDAGVGTDDDVAKNLQDLRRVNKWLGGTRAILTALSELLTTQQSKIATNPDNRREAKSVTSGDAFSLLDVGTGSADIPGAVLDWSEANGFAAEVVGVDYSARNLRVAKSKLGVRRGVQLVEADSLALPFAERSFDFVTASLFLHHFKDEDVVKLLMSFSKIARRAVIVNDLVRDLVPYYFARMSGPILATSFLTRNDGPVSVLRGFTRDELLGFSRSAGLDHVEIRRLFPYRLLLIAHM
ncbi:MAG TPA: methyltransferase domain-containing protein [Blastocatellia bacterium]|nr:methyltransferase domain-containing protein [Blastocatellia bacterium]